MLIAGVLSLYVILVGYSRMYLGVHYATDIVAGWLAASACIIAALAVRSWLRTRSNS
jgi:undecaprenyl-diphosphatase